jgi:DNA-binding PadR family transcriptional regulator
MTVLKGTLDVLILKALTWGPRHGYEIVSWLEERSDGRLTATDAALIQALHRMEERKLIVSHWGTTTNARRARYYRLTQLGRDTLRTESVALADHVRGLTAILNARVAN